MIQYNSQLLLVKVSLFGLIICIDYHIYIFAIKQFTSWFWGSIVLITNHWYFYRLSNVNVPYGNCIRNALPGQLRISWKKCEVIYISVVVYCLVKLLFCYRSCVCACGIGSQGRISVVGLEGSFERALANLANFANFAILNQIIFPILHRHLIAIWIFYLFTWIGLAMLGLSTTVFQ